MYSKITVSGNIISELSEKIPSNIIALNELIKNSYDAGAKKVKIELITLSKKLKIIDDGSGMDNTDIDTLFHIAKSEKKYGEVNTYGRYTQGSKGLGFLSVFKFGDTVVWKTKKEKGFQFSVNFQDLVNSNDISQYPIEIMENQELKNGTEIEIGISEYNMKSLVDYFSDGKNYDKIINTMNDNNFIVELQINDKNYSNTNTLMLKEQLPERQLFYVNYDSKEQKIKFYYNNILVISEDFVFKFTEYSLKIELVIFQFKSYDKSKISKLFYNFRDDLTPLIYVNSNLFNNYDLFDPNVMQNIKKGSVLNQMIGYVNIVSNHHMINFNSDRSQFLQNELTDNIKVFLNSINKTIQEVGSRNKKYLVELDFLKYSELPSEYKDANNEKLKSVIKEDFSFKNQVIIEKIQNKVIYTIFGKSISLNIISLSEQEESSNRPCPAVINLRGDCKEIPIPSAQFDLRKEIVSVTDSNGELVDPDQVIIKVDNIIKEPTVLSSINTPCIKVIEYSYDDSTTGNITVKLTLKFFQPTAKIFGSSQGRKLFSLPTVEGYDITFNSLLCNLINQLNLLEINKNLEIIACCLRASFEISADAINKSSKFIGIFNVNDGLEKKVEKVIDYINKDTYKTQLTYNTGIDFRSLGNILDKTAFSSILSIAHLGAHKSTTYISPNDIESLAKKASIFVVIVNEMINNKNIT